MQISYHHHEAPKIHDLAIAGGKCKTASTLAAENNS